VKRIGSGPTAARAAVGSAFLALVLTGQAWAVGTIRGTVMVPSTDFDPSAGFVVAVNDKMNLYRAQIDADGTYVIENAEPGTYTISAIRGGLSAPDVTGAVLADGQTLEQNIAMVAATPFCILKSASPIPLDQDIDSAAFADAQEIRIGEAKTLGVGPVEEWFADGGPKLVSGRFRVKYSAQAIHLAADVTFAKPLVNPHADDALWTGNALEFDIQNDPYDVTREGKDPEHNWQVVVGLGANADWWEHNTVQGRPTINGQTASVADYIRRVPNETGEKFRLDVPWAILLAGGADGEAIPVPADNSLGAMDIVLDVANPDDPATRKYQIQWSGLGNSHWNASSMVPVRFCATPQ
jgi:hypothetical protein